MDQGQDKKFTRGQFLRGFGKSLLGLAVGGPAAEAAAQITYPNKDGLPFTLVPAGTLDPVMEKIHAVAVDGRDQLYVAGTGGVKVFDRQGKFLRAIGVSAVPAVAVAVDQEGQIYVAQRARVEKFDAEGKRLAAWGRQGKEPGDFQYITALAAHGMHVYVADAGARRIHHFAADGDFIEDFGELAIPAGNSACGAPAADFKDQGQGFLIPSGYFDCAVDAKGILYVGHTGRHRVERYDESGAPLGGWGQFGAALEDFCGCCNPTHLALFADGRVATTEKGTPRLKVYSAEGKLLALLGPEAFAPKVAGLAVAVDSTGRLALVDPAERQIRFYELKAATLQGAVQ